MEKTTQSEQLLLLRRQSTLGQAYRLFYDEPLHLTNGSDVWLYDSAGRQYLDAYNNVASVGHCRPEVVEALMRQATRLNTHTRYLHENVLDYADRLMATMPGLLNNIIFTCTGSEANDLALRIAETVTGGTGIIVTRNAYHGVTKALAQISPSTQSSAYGPQSAATGEQITTIAPHIQHIDAPNLYRAHDQPYAASNFAHTVQHAIDQMLSRGIRPSALIVDTVFASDGIHFGPKDCLRAAAQAIRNAGGLFIADEVQGGLARTGDHWWAFQRDDLAPDIVTMGKPLGNGHPIAALAANAQIITMFGKKNRYFNTFGGNTVSAAVGLSVLDVIERHNLKSDITRVGGYMKGRLEKIANDHPEIGNVRGQGLYIGVELVSDAGKAPASALAHSMLNKLKTQGILIGLCGVHSNILKIRPPLTFQESHADIVVDAIHNLLRNIR